ncbi:unnamed protein product [Citrullus colocynthis]|uniref:Secreted protein n=1 Tax=Citrullus colocynthis TaxID=252529 RepID=A0ABP0YCA5_9ROSI
MFFSLLRCRLVLLHCFSASSRPSRLLIESLRLCCTLPLCLWDSFLINLRHEERHQMLLAGFAPLAEIIWFVSHLLESSYFSKRHKFHKFLWVIRSCRAREFPFVLVCGC